MKSVLLDEMYHLIKVMDNRDNFVLQFVEVEHANSSNHQP